MGGRPKRTPLALAATRPLLVRWWISSRSNSAMVSDFLGDGERFPRLCTHGGQAAGNSIGVNELYSIWSIACSPCSINISAASLSETYLSGVLS